MLPDVLGQWERKQPKHPLAAVFQPLLAESEEVLQRQAAGYFRAIKDSSLSPACKGTLEEVFVSWLEQRFKDKTKKEIETMLLGELPDLEETASGKDLIRIGEQRGEKRGETARRETGVGEGNPFFPFRAARNGPGGDTEEDCETHPGRSGTHDAVSRLVPVARRSHPMAGRLKNQGPTKIQIVEKLAEVGLKHGREHPRPVHRQGAELIFQQVDHGQRPARFIRAALVA